MPKNLEIPPSSISTRSQMRKRHAGGQQDAPEPHQEQELVPDHQPEEDAATDSESGTAEESISEAASASVSIQL